MAIVRTYSELIKLSTFEDRYEYLKLKGVVGEDTFGFDRYLNQFLYHSKRWISVRDKIIIRDNGCDLGISDRQIFGKIIVHHMNLLNKRDILNDTEYLLNPEFLISVSLNTHNAIHYGDKELLVTTPIERSKNDTCPWRH